MVIISLINPSGFNWRNKIPRLYDEYEKINYVLRSGEPKRYDLLNFYDLLEKIKSRIIEVKGKSDQD
jgi:hypothetical protein